MGKLQIRFNRFRALALACFLSFISCNNGLELLVFENPIFCEGGSIDIGEEGANLVINAGSEGDCIRAEGTCNVNITAEDIILNNCQNCINAGDEARVILSAEFEDIRCTSIEDGIKTTDDAAVALIAGDDIHIFSGQGNGIVAEDTSLVELVAPDSCSIQAAENAILADDTAEVDTSGCNELIIE